MTKKDTPVVKRDGTTEAYDVAKIKKSIRLATSGLGVNHLALEAKLDQFVYPGISTSEIQQNVIRHAIQLATPAEPEWTHAAGKAMAMDEWANFKYRGHTLEFVIDRNIEAGFYTAELKEFYSQGDLSVLNAMIDHDRDMEHSFASLVTAKKKYLNGLELNQHMQMVNAMRFGQFEPAETRLEFVQKLYDALSKRKISLATPFLSNLRKGGNVASCFIIAMEDSLESIMDNIKRIGRVSKNGGGLGIFLGLLRAKGSKVNGVPNAAGPITQWIKIINSTLVAVNQNGKRAGAGTVALPIWHNDIELFLDMQTEHGDQRLKSYDVFPQVTVPDIFMERDKNNGMWVTFCPYEVKEELGIDLRGVYGQAFTDAYMKIEAAVLAGKLKVCKVFDKARELTKFMMRTQFETGMPYIAFTDTMNEYNPNKDDVVPHLGIPAVNLCTESFSNVNPDTLGHVCNLLSVVMGNIHSMEELGEISQLATKALDYGIELTCAPDDITQAHNDRYRTIGIGIQGLHDYLAREYLNFRDLSVIREIAECIEYNAVIASAELAGRLGSFKAFEYSEWKKGTRIAAFKKHASGKYDWDYAQKLIDKNGMRNSQLTSPAPNTTTSIYMDSSASVLPVFDSFFIEDNKNGYLAVAAKFLKDNPIGYSKNFPRHTAYEIIDVVAEIQKFTDTGCSMELIFDHRSPAFKAKDLYDAIHYAHTKGIKAIYYIRNIKDNADIVVKEEPACEGCSG